MIGDDLVIASELLKEGKNVAIPTETVYGLAGNATNEEAVLNIFKIKDRPFFDPLIIHVRDIHQARQYVEYFPEKAERLAELFWPGPLTLLLRKNNLIPDLVTSGSPLVAVRVPAHELTLRLLNLLDFPLAAPSANPFSYISPTQAQHVEIQLGNKVPYILDGGSSTIGLESTIVDCTEDKVKVLRLGGLKVEVIEEALGEKVFLALSSGSNPSAPGQLDKHYSPEAGFILTDDPEMEIALHKNKKTAYLGFGTDEVRNVEIVLNLSPSGDIDEAARNLFHYMRLLDGMNPDVIIARRLPESGLGKAVNDRLYRASQK